MADYPETRQRVREQLDQAWSDLMELTNPITDEQLSSGRDASGWSIQDHLDHLSVWEESAAMLLAKRPRAERFAKMGVEISELENLGEDDANAVIRSRMPRRTPAETRAALQASHEHLLRALEPLTDADLSKTYSYYQPEVDSDSGRPIVAWIIGNSADHYRDHLPWIRAIVNSSGGAPATPL